jgi:hypothetical protein
MQWLRFYQLRLMMAMLAGQSLRQGGCRSYLGTLTPAAEDMAWLDDPRMAIGYDEFRRLDSKTESNAALFLNSPPRASLNRQTRSRSLRAIANAGPLSER